MYAFPLGRRQAGAGTAGAGPHGAAVPHGSPDPTVRHLISTGYLSLESSGETSKRSLFEAWIYDNVP